MKSYVWLTFGFLGWAYYEMSGGAEFTPEQPKMAVAQVEDVQTPDVVTRASTSTLLTLSTSNIAPVPAIAETTPVVASVETPVVDVVEPVVATVAEPALDIREVAGSRVNMRIGPGTNFDVITTLNGGTKLEVLEVNADGWANVSVVDRGIEGWMAERLLTDSET